LAGGRKVNGDIDWFRALGEITVLERVRRAQEQGKFSILFDSGIWTGSNAIAMGAQGVLCDHGIHLRVPGLKRWRINQAEEGSEQTSAS
jgi:hypothetical protein